MPVLIGLAVLGVALAIAGACFCKKIRAAESVAQSYGAMERLKLIDETNFANGLGNKDEHLNKVGKPTYKATELDESNGPKTK